MNNNPASGNLADFLADLEQSCDVKRQIAHHRLIPASPASYGECARPWSAAARRILSDGGMRLFSHQAKAMDFIRAGKSVMVSTHTASGKSLIYNLPFHEGFLRDPDIKGLYLFPLKALAQDQRAAFQRLSSSWPAEARPSVELYDGDTPDALRRKIRKSPPAVLMTNPEMLHLSLLAYHESWAGFLANLAYIVVDEAHCYRGIFGSHMAQLFRRLNRICANYGADPVYVFCSATLGNPLDLAQKLSGKDDIELIDESGAPKAPRHFIFMDPEKSSAACAIDLLKKALARDLRTIVYCQSRRMTELISIWASSGSEELRGQISAYRAGFLPEERREIEARMSGGDLKAVVSTSALELGIDIGGLDLCILAGYPGTITQTLQRGGRVGRAGREAAVMVVAGDDALDQYFIRNPQDFFARPLEKAVINPFNALIMERHLECAAAELRLRAGEPWLARPEVSAAVEKLCADNVLLPCAGGGWAAARARPHGGIDLRGCGKSYAIEDQDGNIIGGIDGFRAWRECHPGAVYIHRGRHYLIDSIDGGRMRILAKEAAVSWHTRIRARKETEILELLEKKEAGRCGLLRCRLKITERITGYEKRSNRDGRLLGVLPLDAPEYVFETEGLCFVIPDAVRNKLEAAFMHFMGSIHAMEHAVIGLLPLEIVADRNDFGGISIPLHPQLGLAAVFVYDALPGGAGLAHAAFNAGAGILESTLRAISSCPCEDGCPGCIQSPKCGAGNRPLSKDGAVMLLKEILSPGRDAVEICQSIEISPPSQPEKEAPRTAPLAQDSSLKDNALHYVVFDVETRRSAKEVHGWGNADKMGVSVAVLYDSLDDEYHAYGQDELGGMFERMNSCGLVIGFNSLRFDNQVLGPFWEEWRRADPEKRKGIYDLPSLDLFKKIYQKAGVRISLDSLAQATLNVPKSADGLLALRWWKEGKTEKIAEYCKKDVELTRQLYLHGRENGCVMYRNKAGDLVRLAVDFNPLS